MVLRIKNAPRPDSHSRAIYIIADTTGLRKIGISGLPFERFNNLRRASQNPLTLEFVLCVRSHANLIEFNLHHYFAALHVHGEWFRVSAAEAREVLKQFGESWCCVDLGEPPYNSKIDTKVRLALVD